MIIHVTRKRVECDGVVMKEGLATKTPCRRAASVHISSGGAIAQAIAEGWQVTGGKHLCPVCRVEEKKT